MSTMEEKEIQAKRNKMDSMQASMDMRIIGLNIFLSIVLIALIAKQIFGF